jgi:hypothetical protein
MGILDPGRRSAQISIHTDTARYLIGMSVYRKRLVCYRKRKVAKCEWNFVELAILNEKLLKYLKKGLI